MAGMRLDRINEELKRALANILQNEIKDPRLCSMCSILYVETTGDLKYAKVWVSVLGSEKERKESMESLKSAKGYIKKILSRQVTIRRIPELIFVLDDSIEYGIHIEKLLHDISTD